MNYIHHLNNWFAKIQADNRLKPTHVSLYLALFHQWNLNRFSNPISITREETMSISKIGSRTTYLKCLHELSTFGYIEYIPSQNPFMGSQVNMINFWTSPEQVLVKSQTKNWTSAGQVVGPSINSNKPIKHINSESEKNKKYDEPL